MSSVGNPDLKWNFEAFRQYLSFEVLQQAASALLVFDGFNYRDDISETKSFENLLKARTGLEWSPKREAPEGVLFDPEGSVFRNKARVLTSMLILDPVLLQNQKIVKLTEFGRLLGGGRVSKSDFYEFELKNFEYPHPAYPDGAAGWISHRAKVKPFLYLVEVLIGLVDQGVAENRLTSKEFLEFLMPNSPDFRVETAVSAILKSREAPGDFRTSFPPDDMRNASDILGFLCMTGFTYFLSPGEIALNLISVSEKDKTYYYMKSRDGDFAIEAVKTKLGLKGG